jgi:hypothetical protein
MKDKKNVKYCLCTEAANITFPYLRVAISSFVNNNPWFNGNIILLVNESLPFSKHNEETIRKIYSNITLKNVEIPLDINDSYSKLDLYKIQCFSMEEYDFILYLNHLSICLKEVAFDIFKGDCDIVSCSNSRCVTPNENNKNDKVFNSNFMLISSDVISHNLSNKILNRLSRYKKIKTDTINKCINDVVYLNDISVNILSNTVFIKKSLFPDSKKNIFYSICKNICFIELDIGIREKNSSFSLRYKTLDRIWLKYNKEHLVEINLNPSINRNHIETHKKNLEIRKRLNNRNKSGRPNLHNSGELSHRRRKTYYKPPFEKYPMPGTSYICIIENNDISHLKKFLDSNIKMPTKYEILIGIYHMSSKSDSIIKELSKIDNVHLVLLKSKDSSVMLNTLSSQCLYEEYPLRYINYNGNSITFKYNSNTKCCDYEFYNKIKIGILTAAYKRKELTSYYCKHLSHLRELFKNEIDIISVVVDSYKINEKAVIENNQIYFSRRNKPVSNKFNYGMNYYRDKKIDGVIVLGSDNFMCEKLFKKYIKIIRNNYDLIGVLDSFMYDSITDKMFYFPGYTNRRHGESVGTGRMLSSKLLETLDYTPWDNGLNKGLDGSMWKKIKQLNIDEYKILTKVNNFLMLGVKTDVFITDIKRIKTKTLDNLLLLKKIKCLNGYRK